MLRKEKLWRDSEPSLTFQLRVSPDKVDALLPALTNDILQDRVDLTREVRRAKDPPCFVVEEDGARKGVECFLALHNHDVYASLMQQECEQKANWAGSDDQDFAALGAHCRGRSGHCRR
jgi:hypothetical protein